MPRIKSFITLELGKIYEFTLASGTKRKVIVRGTRATSAGDVLSIEVDGKLGEFGDLNQAIGCTYTNVAEVLP